MTVIITALFLKVDWIWLLKKGFPHTIFYHFVPILKSQNIQITDWESKELKLENDTAYKYNTIVSSSTEIYDSALSSIEIEDV